MRIRTLFIGFFCLLFMLSASSQIVVNKDSLSLVRKLTADKEKLLKYQSQVADRTREKEETAAKAQQSADENRQAAIKLTNDPQDRKLARVADNAASSARSDAKKARKAADRFDDLNKDIRDLTDKIEKEQIKLDGYVRQNPKPQTEPAVVVPKDSTVPLHPPSNPAPAVR
jgi:hypothetical protein